MHKNVIIPLLCQSWLFINTKCLKIQLCLKMRLSTFVDITWYAEVAIYAKNLFFFSFYSVLLKFREIHREVVEQNWQSVTWKIVKNFARPKQRATIRKLFSLLPLTKSPDQILSFLWNKNILTEIYRNVQTFAFKVLRECSLRASRKGSMQCYFWHQTETCLLENL